MSQQSPAPIDPEQWPLAPGNAPADIEAALTAEADRWPEPSAALRERVSQILRRPQHRAAS